MKIPPHILDEIRARISVSDVVGRRVRLKRQGREFAGLSPFNPEKTPSFFVNDAKGFYHCFSSGRHGDVFRFLMEVDGLSFVEAVEQLAREAGVDLPKPTKEDADLARSRATIAEITENAAAFFEGRLRAPGADLARSYAAKRRLRDETVREFRIGYAPPGGALVKHLAARGVTPQQMVDAGLAVIDEGGGPARDRFRNRLMIPIQNPRGDVIAFGGRALTPDQKPKYLNSPETDLFHKGDGLFNSHRAKPAAADGQRLLVVEGYLDAISVYQAGHAAVVAPLGTALTEAQVAALWRLAPEPVICFDGDAAGIKAAHRAIDRLLPDLQPALSAAFAFLPDGKDPDDVIAAGGLAALLHQVEAARPLSDVLWERETAGVDVRTPESRAGLEARVEDVVRQIKARPVQFAYRRQFRSRLSDMFWRADRARPAPGGHAGGFRGMRPVSVALASGAAVERALLGLCVEYPRNAEIEADRLLAIDFLDPTLNAFRDEVLRVSPEADTAAEVRARMDPSFARTLAEVHGAAEAGEKLRARLGAVAADPPQPWVDLCFRHFVDRAEVAAMERDLKTAIHEISADSDASADQRIMALSLEIARRMREFAKDEAALAEMAAAHRSRTPPP